MSDQCLFCKIISGDIPSTKVYEDDRVLAFMDINPINEGHLMVVPRNHVGTIYDIGPEDLAAVMTAAKNLARAQLAVLKMPGLNLVQNNGRSANQVVDHFHVHLVPRWPEDGWAHWQGGSLIPGDPAGIEAMAARIRAEVATGDDR